MFKQFRLLLGVQMAGIGIRMANARIRIPGQKKTALAPFAMILLWGMVGLSFAVMFGSLFVMIAEPFHTMGLDWLYMTMTVLMTSMIMMIGTVFLAKSILFEAKDNAILLTMPIPPTVILTVRMTALYLMNLLWGLTVMIPALGCYIYYVGFSLGMFLRAILFYLLAALFVLALSCLLGWGLSLITARIRHKSFFTVACSLAFIAAYYYVVGTSSSRIMELLTNGELLSEKLGAIGPLYRIGDAIAAGTASSVLSSVLLLVVPLLAVYVILAATFLKTVTSSHGFKRIRYDAEKHMGVSSADRALFKRENRHLLSSAIYLLNAGIGALMLAVAAVAALIKYDMVMTVLAFYGQDMVAALFCGMVSMILCMILFTPPSVSLEAKSLWIVRALPVSSAQILHAKWKLHIVWCAVPTLLASVVGLIFLYTFDNSALMADPAMASLIPQTQMTGFDWIAGTIAILVLPQLFSVVSGGIGLLLGLRFPNLNWTNEAQVVKQGMAVFVSMFGNVVLLAIPAATVYFGRDYVPVSVLLLIWTAVFAVGIPIVKRILDTWGCKAFETLSV
ncbi:MAG: hypothetical protein IKZ09_09290 [Clostridia bacterium]|nr:hypothetical protein [Clostridia bacterium]